MLEAVQHRNVYADLMVAAGMAPPGASKQSHPAERELAKAVSWVSDTANHPPDWPCEQG